MEKPNRKTDIMAKEIGSETLLYSAEQKSIHVLNPTARLIWEMCDGAHDVTDMVEELSSYFNVTDGQDLHGDIERTLAVFAEKGLLQAGQ